MSRREEQNPEIGTLTKVAFFPLLHVFFQPCVKGWTRPSRKTVCGELGELHAEAHLYLPDFYGAQVVS